MSATFQRSELFERTAEQRERALARANEIRSLRSTLKRSITGPSHAAAIILDPPWYLQTMKVDQLLLAIPKLGRVKVDVFMRTVRVSPSKRVGGLSDRQKTEIAKELNR